MTKEEAIEILKTDSCVDCGVGSQSPYACTFDGHCDIKDAMKMVIRALEQQPSDDCVSRKAVYFKLTNGAYSDENIEQFIDRIVKELENMPPVTPTHGICKECKYCEDIGIKGTFYCKRYGINHLDNYYCADYEKRGDSNGV